MVHRRWEHGRRTALGEVVRRRRVLSSAGSPPIRQLASGTVAGHWRHTDRVPCWQPCKYQPHCIGRAPQSVAGRARTLIGLQTPAMRHAMSASVAPVHSVGVSRVPKHRQHHQQQQQTGACVRMWSAIKMAALVCRCVAQLGATGALQVMPLHPLIWNRVQMCHSERQSNAHLAIILVTGGRTDRRMFTLLPIIVHPHWRWCCSTRPHWCTASLRALWLTWTSVTRLVLAVQDKPTPPHRLAREQPSAVSARVQINQRFRVFARAPNCHQTVHNAKGVPRIIRA